MMTDSEDQLKGLGALAAWDNYAAAKDIEQACDSCWTAWNTNINWYLRWVGSLV